MKISGVCKCNNCGNNIEWESEIKDYPAQEVSNAFDINSDKVYLANVYPTDNICNISLYCPRCEYPNHTEYVIGDN